MNWLTSRCAPLVALATLALAGCDTGTALNVDLPDTAGITTQYQDFDVTSGTVRIAPVQTQKTDHFLVGRLVDNIAGATSAAAFLNVVDSSVNDSLPSKFTDPAVFTSTLLDSTVVVLGFDRVYGSSSTPARFDVYALSTPLDERQVYNAGSEESGLQLLRSNVPSRLDRTRTLTVAATGTAAAYTTTVPDPTVRLVLQRRVGTPAQPALALPLATTLFNRLLQPSFTQTQLESIVKGIALKPNATYNSAIVSFGRPSIQRVQLYFHSVSKKTTKDTLNRSYSFFIGPVFSSSRLSDKSDPRYYTRIENVLPGPLAGLSSRDGFVPTSVLNGLSYAQEGTGLGTRITFRGLEPLATAAQAGTLTINRAEIRVPVRPFSNALFPNPTQLFAVEVDARNNVLQRILNYIPTDRVVQADGTSQTATGFPTAGVLNTEASQPYYAIPVTSYLQAYLSNRLDGNPAALVLAPNFQSSNTLSLNRAAIDADNIKLRVYFTKR